MEWREGKGERRERWRIAGEREEDNQSVGLERDFCVRYMSLYTLDLYRLSEV